jgi:pimeloyl-ACP methyl ester carboxylesterase
VGVEIERIGRLTSLHAAPVTIARDVPIVLLHGLWAGGWIFEGWVEAAADDGWDAWAPNLRGRGGSEPAERLGLARLEDFADDLCTVLDSLGPAVVVGYSMGGLVTQVAMARRGAGERIRAAALMCTVPPRSIVAMSVPVLVRSWRYLPAMVSGGLMLPTRADTEAILMNAMPEAERARWLPRFVPDSGRAALEAAVGAVRVEATEVACPVLVVSAERDHISPPSIQRSLVTRYGAEHLPVAGHAHLMAIESGWRRIAAAVLGWAARTVEAS